jgi:hypothetical protein
MWTGEPRGNDERGVEAPRFILLAVNTDMRVSASHTDRYSWLTSLGLYIVYA